MGSSSRASTTTASTTQQTSRNLNLQDTEGVTVGEAGGNVTVIQTDHNAFDRASSLAELAVQAGRDIGTEASRLSFETSQLVTESSRRALDTVSDFSSGAIIEVGNANARALQFGEQAFGTVEKALGEVGGAYRDSAGFQRNALETVEDFARDSLANSTNLFQDAFTGIRDFIGDLQGKSLDQIGSTVTALNTIAREQSKSTDERVAEVSQNAIKYIVIAVGVLAAGAVVVAIVRRKS